MWIVFGSTLSVAFGLVVAVLADRSRFEKIAKSFIFLPMAISFVGASIIWNFIYEFRPENQPQVGLLNAVVVGRSNIVGKPMASLLLQAHATVTICHSRTKDLPGVVKRADIVVAAVGRANMVTGDWIKPGAVVIDVGINRIETTVDGETKSKLTGDVDYESVCEIAKAVTPVPGGVGPMTIVMLMANTLRAARLSAGLDG